METSKEWGFYQRALDQLGQYVDSMVAPRLDSITDLASRRRAIRLIYGCAFSVAEPLVDCPRMSAFRGHAVLCRALWEHWIDFNTIRIADDAVGELYLEYSDVQAWVHFTRVRETRQTLGFEEIPVPIDEPGADDYVRAIVRENYGLPLEAAKSIKSWNQRSLYDRAKALGPEHELHYREFYSLQSWSAHGTATGVIGVDSAFLDRCALQWRADSFDALLKMTILTLTEFGWLQDHDEELARIAELAIGDYVSGEERSGSD